MASLVAPLDDVTPDVSTAIARAQAIGALSSTVLPRIWARRPELAGAQIALHSRFYDSAILPGRLLELVRLRIAALNACQVCQTSRKSDDVTEDDVACLSDDDGRFTPAERAALSFASALAADHLSIGTDEINTLRAHFTDDEIVELGMFAALMSGSGRLAYAFRAFGGLTVITDVHAHAVISRYHRLLADAGVAIPGYGKGAPGLVGDVDLVTDSEQAIDNRVALMDQSGVGRQLLSALFPPYLAAEADAVAAARCVNDAHAAIVGRRPDRLSAYAALPLPHIDASLSELRRCLDDLGMIGVALQCFCFDESLAAERFDPIYAELNRREAVVFFHPCVNGLCSPLITEWGLAPTAGTVFEDTTIALHLILRRIPARFPGISFIVPHLGGALPMLLNRLDNQLALSAPDLSEKPSATARRFYYDTVGHGSVAALRCAVDAFGADRVLPGSDYPVLLAFESYRDTFGYLVNAGLDDAALDRILTINAAELFKEV